jgi:molybdopterin molybdotransferase
MYGMLTRSAASHRHGRGPRRSAAARAAFREAAATADVVITSGGVSVGEADFVKDLLNKLGEVVFWKIAMKPGRPARLRQDRQRALLRPARQPGLGDGHVLPVRARCAAEALRRDPVPMPTFKVPCTSLRKAPGRTEFQRGILQRDEHGTLSVRVTGEQGSGILRSMSEANCFIILPTHVARQGKASRRAIDNAALVDVQVMEGVAAAFALAARCRPTPSGCASPPAIRRRWSMPD